MPPLRPTSLTQSEHVRAVSHLLPELGSLRLRHVAQLGELARGGSIAAGPLPARRPKPELRLRFGRHAQQPGRLRAQRLPP